MSTDPKPATPQQILVVDDHQPAAMMLKRIFEDLEQQKYQVHCLYSGEDALEWLKSHRPELIILDVMMPGLNGFEVLTRLRQNPETADIPTILATAKDTSEDIEQGLSLGADDYVPKPIKPRELLARARSKIEAYQLRQKLKRRTKDLQALLHLSEALHAHLDAHQVINLLPLLTVDLLPAQYAQLVLFDEHHQQIESVVSHEDTVPRIIDIPYQQFLEMPMITWSYNNAEQRTRYAIAHLLPHEEDGYAVLSIESDEPLDEQHLRVFEAIARQGTLTLKNALLYQTKIQYANHLESMVDERTHELEATQRQLMQSEKLASVGRLAAGIAHEINNPLTPIRLILEGILEDIEYGDEIRVEDIQRILESVIRIKTIVERLQQFTRMPHQDIAMQAFGVNQVIHNVIELTRKVLEQADIKLHLDVQPARIIGNTDQLEQVLLNLVLNAHTAIGQHGNITVKCHSANDEVTISVTDDGVGIPKEIVNQIFEPFMTTRDEGTGLGLFVSYAIVQNHQGQIQVESQPQRGTTFRIILPRAPQAF